MESKYSLPTDSSKRLYYLLIYLDISADQFAANIGFRYNSCVHDILNGINQIDKGFAYIVNKTYPEVDKNWLLTGEGNMITI